MNVVATIKRKGYFAGFLMGAGKILMAIISHSWLLFIHAVYNIIRTCARHYAAREIEGRYKTMFYSGFLVIAASAVYLIYSIYIFCFGSTASYHMYIAIGIAAVTTFELILSMHGLRKARQKKDVQEETIKYINFASALISVSLTQTAILSFTHENDMSGAYAIGDAVFGFLALLVGVFMLLRANKLERID